MHLRVKRKIDYLTVYYVVQSKFLWLFWLDISPRMDYYEDAVEFMLDTIDEERKRDSLLVGWKKKKGIE